MRKIFILLLILMLCIGCTSTSTGGNTYQECYYGNNCPYTEEITLGKLASNGYLTTNNKDDSLINPMTKEDISNCTIIVKYNDGKVTVTPKEETSSCPSRGDYE